MQIMDKALELADLIGMCGDGGYNQEAATMLRQQQEKLTKYELRNIYQCDRIAILEAQLRKAQKNG